MMSAGSIELIRLVYYEIIEILRLWPGFGTCHKEQCHSMRTIGAIGEKGIDMVTSNEYYTLPA